MSTTKPIISIVIPGIRTERWDALVQSIDNSVGTDSWELIFVGPEPAKDDLDPRARFIQDWGSPNRCQMVGACAARGKYIMFSADDCLFIPGRLEQAIIKCHENEGSIISTKYTEGCDTIQPDSYYKLALAYPRTPLINPDWWILNSAVYPLELFKRFGGFDTQFEVTCLAHADMAARTQHHGINVIMMQEPLIRCGHMPNTTGDHAPVHHAHLQDEQRYLQKFMNPSKCWNHMDWEGWKYAPSKWVRRFK